MFLVQYNRSYEAAYANISNEITGSISKEVNDVTSYFKLRKVNEQLHQQNTELLNLLNINFEAPDTAKTIIIDSLLKDTMGRVQKFVYLPARVVNNSVTQENNYITLHRGSKQGVKQDMGVVGPNGVVGRIILVSNNYSIAMSLLNHNAKVSAMLKKGFYSGIVDWDGRNPSEVILHNISKSAQIKKGDTVITSNLSGSFPPGLLIGRVKEIESMASSNFYTLRLQTATEFSSLQYVYLIENTLWDEQKNIEAQIPKSQ
jgi:rod shape-determining protein MreC